MAKKKKSGSKLLRNLIIVVVVLLALVFLARAMGWVGKEKLDEIQVGLVKKVRIVEKVTASGKVQPETEVKISPDVSGEIVDVYIKEGDSVKQGQLLIRIRPDNFQDAAQSARASLNSVKSNSSQAQAVYLQRKAELARTEAEYERNKKLFDQKVISETDFLTAKTNFEVAKQQLKAAGESAQAANFNVQSSQANLSQSIDNLSRTEIYAPVSGIISKLSVEKGEKVVGTAQMAGTEMLIIANLDDMEVQVDVNENDIIKVKEGQTVEIDVDAYSSTGKKFKGIVTEISNTANNTTSADAVTEFTVKIRILPESYKDLKKAGRSPFRPGMTAAVDIITNQQDNVVSVPISAVTTRTASQLQEKGGNSGKTSKPVSNIEENKDTKAKGLEDDVKEVVFLYNAEKGEVRTQEVSTGISDFENIQIVKGLKEGDKIVIGPFNLISKLLENGQKVTKSDDSK
jgi:HlyD family secretion protein